MLLFLLRNLEKFMKSILVENGGLIYLGCFLNKVLSRFPGQIQIIEVAFILWKQLLKLIFWLNFVLFQGVNGEAPHVILDERVPLKALTVSIEFS